jgi:hypothetical protein
MREDTKNFSSISADQKKPPPPKETGHLFFSVDPPRLELIHAHSLPYIIKH